MTSTQIIIILVALIAVVLLAAIVWTTYRRRSLRQRFGPEYDRVVAEHDSRTVAEREVRVRERKYAELEVKPLDPASREQYATAWSEIQNRFIDAPNQAVSEADELVTRLIAERGYPSDSYEDQVATLSVEHAKTLGNYRDAHEINRKNERGEATTEELRQAVVHYRALFADLLGDDPVRVPGTRHEEER